MKNFEKWISADIKCLDNWCSTWKNWCWVTLSSMVYLNAKLGWFLDILNIVSLSKSLKGLRDLCVAIVKVWSSRPQAIINWFLWRDGFKVSKIFCTFLLPDVITLSFQALSVFLTSYGLQHEMRLLKRKNMKKLCSAWFKNPGKSYFTGNLTLIAASTTPVSNTFDTCFFSFFFKIFLKCLLSL